MSKKKRNSIPQIIIGESATEIKRPVLSGVLFRFITACLISVGMTLTLIEIYELPVNPGVCFFVTVLMQLILFTAVSCIRKVYVISGTAVLSALAALLLGNSFINSLLYFKDCLLISLDSRLLHTMSFLSFKTWKLTEENASFTRGVLIIFVFFIVVVTLTTALCTYRKPHISVSLSMFIVLSAAAFIAERCEFVIAMIPFFAGVFMLFAISSSYSTEKLLAGINSQSVRLSDKEFNKRNRKRKLYKKLKHRFLRYGKFNINAVWGAAIAVISIGIGSAIFNDRKSIDYTEIYHSLSEISDNLRNFVQNIGLGSDSAFDDYFSTTYRGKNNSSLSINSPGTGEGEVLKVIVDDADNPIYLRGDIGVDFTGSSWTTLPENSKSDYAELFENYIPETETKTFYNIISLSGLDTSKYMCLQNVQLDYLQNTDVVLLPTSPYEYSYRSSDNFAVNGDTIIRTKQNFIETVQCSAVYPIITDDMVTAFEWAEDLVSLWDMNLLTSISLSSDIPAESLQNYEQLQQEYRDYVYATYLSVPENMKWELDDFISRRFGSVEGYFSNTNMSERFNSANALCKYLKNNYTYSLNFDSTAANSVMRFLSVTKSGHCALYASSMVLILREVGIPARYCTGFVADGDGAYTDNGYEITMREKNLHAWVEVYFDEFGWLPFDPTGAATGANSTTESTPRVTTSPRNTTPRVTASEPQTTDTAITTSPDSVNGEVIDMTVIIIAVGAVLFILVIVSGIAFILNTKKRIEKLFSSFRSSEPTAAVKKMYRFIFSLLTLCDIEQNSGELLADFAERIDKLTAVNTKMSELVPLFEAIEFGKEDVNESEREKVFEYVRALYGKIIGEQSFIKRIYLMYRVVK